MSEFYDDIADTASEILAEFGQMVTLTRPGSGGEYNPDTGNVEGGSDVNYPGFAAVFDYAQNLIDGANIRQGDRRAYMAPDLPTTPTTGDFLTLADGTRLAVVESRPLSPAGVVVLHDVQVRGVA